MINFFNISYRWGKERPLNTRLLIQNVEAPYYDLESVPGIDDSSGWNAQVFRSITSDSARFQLENETSFTTKKGMAKLQTVYVTNVERCIMLYFREIIIPIKFTK